MPSNNNAFVSFKFSPRGFANEFCIYVLTYVEWVEFAEAEAGNPNSRFFSIMRHRKADAAIARAQKMDRAEAAHARASKAWGEESYRSFFVSPKIPS